MHHLALATGVLWSQAYMTTLNWSPLEVVLLQLSHTGDQASSMQNFGGTSYIQNAALCDLTVLTTFVLSVLKFRS